MSFLNVESPTSGQITPSVQLPSSAPSWNPHPYQIQGIKILIGQGSAGLFLDPGLGKTSICLAGFKVLKSRSFAHKMLIIAPLRPCYAVWPLEIQKWKDFQGLTYTVLHGKDKDRNLQKDVDIYITTPEGLGWLFAPGRARPKFDVLCVDESSKFKNSQTQRFKLLKPLLPYFMYKWILTGTPVPNGLIDLFGQIFILDQGRALGRYITHFRNEFFYPTGYEGYDWKPQHDAFVRILERIKPLILQLSAEDHLQMPELLSVSVPVTLPKEAWTIYRRVEDQFYAELEASDNPIVAANKAVAGGKCRQIANGACYTQNPEWVAVHDAKLDALEDLIGELGGKPVLVLYEFDHDRQRICTRFPTARVLGSGTSAKQLETIIREFNAGSIPILLGHPASMGHGLNLQAGCNHVVWFGITWNLEFYDQAIARVYRQGQKSGAVFVYHLVATGTQDERVMNALVAKDRTQQSLLNALGGKRND